MKRNHGCGKIVASMRRAALWASALAVLTWGAGCRPLCDGVSDTCIEIELVGSGSFSQIEAEWRVADPGARTSRHGIIESPVGLSRWLRAMPPPGVSPQALRTLTLQAIESASCRLHDDETSCERAAAALLFNGEPLVDGASGIPLTTGDQLSLAVKPFVFRSGSVEDLPSPYTQALARDLDGDGQAELVLTYSNLQIGLLRRGSAGRFVEYDRSISASSDQPVTLQDWNSDGRLDLLSASEATLNIRPGNGDGTFAEPITLTADWPIGPVVVGDFDGTPPADLVAAELVSCSPQASCRPTPYHFALWPNNQQAATVQTLPYSNDATNPGYFPGGGLLALNITQEGPQDLILVDDMTNTVRAAPGNSTMPLADSEIIPELGALSICALSPASLMTDMNDLIGSLCDEPYGVAVFTGVRFGQPLKKTGQFLSSLPADSRKYTLNVADWNGDGRSDAALIDFIPNRSVSFLAGHSDGTLSPLVSFAVPEPATGLAVADLNGDGRVDLLVSHASSQRLSILYNYAR